MAEGVTATALKVFIAHLADVAVSILRNELLLAVNAEAFAIVGHRRQLLSICRYPDSTMGV